MRFKVADRVRVKRGYSLSDWSNENMVQSLNMDYDKEYIVTKIDSDSTMFLLGFSNRFSPSRFEFNKNKIVTEILNDL